MNYCFLDFESYWDHEFSLEKMPIDNYVVDERFKIHGVAFKWNDEPTRWLPGKESMLLKDLPWNDTILVAHNAYLEGFILNHWYKRSAQKYYCTMCMGRGLFGPDVSNSLASVATRLKLGKKGDELINTKGKRYLAPDQLERLGVYAINDDDLCAAAFWQMHPQLPPSELNLIDITLRMFVEPKLVLNTERLTAFYEKTVDERIEKLLELYWVLDYTEKFKMRSFIDADDKSVAQKIKKVLMSNDQFSDLLVKLGGEVKTKTGRKGQIPALGKNDDGLKELLRSENPKIAQAAKARLLVKSTMAESRSEAFLDVGNRPFPIQLLYCKARSTRWAGGGKRNPQNLPRKSELRKSIEAPGGYVVAACDSAQIEARCNAWVASIITGSECALMPIFRRNGDPYGEFGTVVYGYEVTKDNPNTSQERWVAKQAVLGLGYQMSWRKFQIHMKAMADKLFPDDFCQNVVTVYRNTYPEIPQLWNFMQTMLDVIYDKGYRDMGFWGVDEIGIRLPSGLHIIYDELQRVEGQYGWEYSYMGWEQGKRKRVSLYGGKACENLIQGIARCVVAEQMEVIASRYDVVMFTHDEIVSLIPEGEADEGMAWMVEVMSTPPAWGKTLPVFAEGGYAKNYSK